MTAAQFSIVQIDGETALVVLDGQPVAVVAAKPADASHGDDTARPAASFYKIIVRGEHDGTAAGRALAPRLLESSVSGSSIQFEVSAPGIDPQAVAEAIRNA